MPDTMNIQTYMNVKRHFNATTNVLCSSSLYGSHMGIMLHSSLSFLGEFLGDLSPWITLATPANIRATPVNMVTTTIPQFHFRTCLISAWYAESTSGSFESHNLSSSSRIASSISETLHTWYIRNLLNIQPPESKKTWLEMMSSLLAPDLTKWMNLAMTRMINSTPKPWKIRLYNP